MQLEILKMVGGEGGSKKKMLLHVLVFVLFFFCEPVSLHDVEAFLCCLTLY